MKSILVTSEDCKRWRLDTATNGTALPFLQHFSHVMLVPDINVC